jgi:hypothetical protein
MENNVQENPEIIQTTAELQITPEAVSFLATTARWTKFLSILGFIMTGFLIIAGIALSVFLSTFGNTMENSGPMSYFNSGYIGLIYVAFAIIYIWPVIYLNNFSNATTRAVRSGSTERLTYAFRNLKRMFQFIGILTIVLLVIYVIAIIAIVVAGSLML